MPTIPALDDSCRKIAGPSASPPGLGSSKLSERLRQGVKVETIEKGHPDVSL